MKNKQKNYVDYDAETMIASAIIYTPKGKVFVGTAQCHPDDADFANALTGEEIAFRRASIKMLEDVRDNELKPAIEALNSYLYSINKGQYFDKKNPMVKILYHNINIRQEELSMINDMIKEEKKQLKDYLAAKEQLYEKLRAHKAKRSADKKE